jgi:hypothetical protein
MYPPTGYSATFLSTCIPFDFDSIPQETWDKILEGCDTPLTESNQLSDNFANHNSNALLEWHKSASQTSPPSPPPIVRSTACFRPTQTAGTFNDVGKQSAAFSSGPLTQTSSSTIISSLSNTRQHQLKIDGSTKEGRQSRASRRAAVACAQCRRRKAKCSRAWNAITCDACQKRQMVCEFEDTVGHLVAMRPNVVEKDIQEDTERKHPIPAKGQTRLRAQYTPSRPQPPNRIQKSYVFVNKTSQSTCLTRSEAVEKSDIYSQVQKFRRSGLCRK